MIITAGGNGELAAFFHCVNRVFNQVRENLKQITAANIGHIRVVMAVDGHFVSQRL